jgi:hypothetical protein
MGLTVPRFDRSFIERRNHRLRADAAKGQSVDWLMATYGVSRKSVYRITEGTLIEPPSKIIAEPLAEWEITLREAGYTPSKVNPPRPTREWVEALEDAVLDDAFDRSCVYFVQEEGDDAYLKIGVSSSRSFAGRMSGLRSGNARRLVVTRIVAGDVATEARLHAYFSTLRMRGEWFRVDDELAVVARARLSSGAFV